MHAVVERRITMEDLIGRLERLAEGIREPDAQDRQHLLEDVRLCIQRWKILVHNAELVELKSENPTLATLTLLEQAAEDAHYLHALIAAANELDAALDSGTIPVETVWQLCRLLATYPQRVERYAPRTNA